jgi:hypothetical protein
MIFVVGVAVIVLAALFMFVFVVTMQIHREERRYRQERRAWEERRQWNRSLHREQIPIPLTRPAADRWARFGRSACGVYINGIGGVPAPRPEPTQVPQPEPADALPWYARTIQSRLS